MNAVGATLFHAHSLGLPLQVIQMTLTSLHHNHLYRDVHALPYAGVGVHHLVLGQQQTLFVAPGQVS